MARSTMMVRYPAYAALCAIGLAPLSFATACGAGGSARTTVAPSPLATAAPVVWDRGGAGIDVAALDTTIDACTDFYQYACGSWIRSTTIPDDQPRWYRGSTAIFERNEMRLNAILVKDETAGAAAGGDPYAQKLGDSYASCMDEAAIEKAGTTALRPYLALIAKVHDAVSFTGALALFHRSGLRMFFDFDSDHDLGDATHDIASISQGGIGLPDRDYYLSDDAKMKAIRDTYLDHVARTFVLLGEVPRLAKEHAATVMRMETEMARASLTGTDRREPRNRYHKLPTNELARLAPSFVWTAYLRDMGQPELGSLNIEHPDFLVAFARFDGRWADVQTYMRWHLVRALTPYLPKRFVEEGFTLKSALSGAPRMLPRWKLCTREVDARMGEALAIPFVREVLGEEGKADTRRMISGIEEAMRADLTEVPWMDAASRRAALEKLAKIANKVGYPDVWRNYDALDVVRGKYLENGVAALAFETRRQLDKIGKPVDRGEWIMSPPTVGAYYIASLNEIAFLAGILQPPYYAVGMKPWVAFGAIGIVMGHELTHGFDDEGRQFDADGNLREWWTKEVSAAFDDRAACVARQYDGYTVLGDVHLNGRLTLGENLADLGGVKLAYLAMQRATAGFVDAPAAHGRSFTKEQQFFLAYGQGWCGKEREEETRMRAATDPHSPAQYRVNGPLSDFPPFAAAFGCKEGAKMVRPPADRCEVW